MPWDIPVLVFHHVSPTIDYYTNTPPEVFARQIQWLAEEWRFWTAAEAYAAFQAGESPAGRVVITFDDGYEDNFLYARPILNAHGVRATFFILADFVDRTNEWNPQCGYQARHMNLNHLRLLASEGHELGGHGLSHRKMTELAPDTVEHELRECRRRLAAWLTRDILTFAYPYGLCNPAVTAMAQKHYRVAFSTVKSFHRDWEQHRHALRRIYLPVGASRDDVLKLVDGTLML